MAARLSRDERAVIEAHTRAGAKPEEVAGLIGRAPSTVYRELGRCGGAGCYSAERAQQHAEGLARRPRLTLACVMGNGRIAPPGREGKALLLVRAENRAVDMSTNAERRPRRRPHPMTIAATGQRGRTSARSPQAALALALGVEPSQALESSETGIGGREPSTD